MNANCSQYEQVELDDTWVFTIAAAGVDNSYTQIALTSICAGS